MKSYDRPTHRGMPVRLRRGNRDQVGIYRLPVNKTITEARWISQSAVNCHTVSSRKTIGSSEVAIELKYTPLHAWVSQESVICMAYLSRHQWKLATSLLAEYRRGNEAAWHLIVHLE